MKTYRMKKNNFFISTSKSKLNLGFIHDYLSNESYWAKNIPLEIVKKSIEGSVCFGLYDEEKQIGFARVITDNATFGYLADVFILQQYRGQGLGKYMIQTIIDHPELQGFRIIRSGLSIGMNPNRAYNPCASLVASIHLRNPCRSGCCIIACIIYFPNPCPRYCCKIKTSAR